MSRDHKAAKQQKENQEHARQSDYSRAIKEPGPDTWPARMPPYCYTVLCPVRGMRERKGK